jgi:acyl-CoA synthetase (AMP-forming)/AMP-acid ligase II
MPLPSLGAPTTVGELLAQVVQAHAPQTAYETPHTRWTFADVERAVRQVASRLQRLGVQPGDRVAALTKLTAETTVLVLAAAHIGAVCCPINWRLSPAELTQVLQDAGARFLMADGEFLAVARALDLPLLLAVVPTLDGAEPGLAKWANDGGAEVPAFPAQPSDTALQLYSSGTTGLPKGVEITHDNVLAMCEDVPRELVLGATSANLNVLPVFHIAGIGMSLSVLMSGGKTVAWPDFEPARIIAGIGIHGITHMFLVPSMIQMLLQTPGVEQGHYERLQLIGYGASPVTEHVLQEAMRVFGCQLTQTYGMTETTGMVVALRPHDHDPKGPRAHLLRAAGQAVASTQLRIVDTISLQDLPDGEVGEVLIRSRMNLKQYWRNPKATAEALLPADDGVAPHWLRTGDAGYLQDGYLYIRDRIKDMVISGGENIYPIEVENVLAKHPAVADCAVIGIADVKWGEAVQACIVLRPGASATEAELIDYCRERIARYKCPRHVVFLEAMPRNPSGKILKKVLRDQYKTAA